jgi:hypothetical protein
LLRPPSFDLDGHSGYHREKDIEQALEKSTRQGEAA